jgi:large subunit ribosomal protein L6
MSRIGKKPVLIPKGVTVTLDGSKITVKGPKGELSRSLPGAMLVSMKDNEVVVERPSDENEHKALHGLTRTLVANMVEGVTNGYEKRLEIQGVGYRAALKGSSIEFALGYSHSITVDPPSGIEFEVPAPTQVVVRGIDKQAVGQVAAEIRRLRPPEPYKGKGIRYQGEVVLRKVGKRA